MKRKIILIVISSILLLAGIITPIVITNLEPKDNDRDTSIKETTLKELERPKNLLINDNVLSWDSVNNAKKYKIFINDAVYESNNNSFDLSGISLNKFKIKVIACAPNEYLNSMPSVEIIHVKTINEEEYLKFQKSIKESVVYNIDDNLLDEFVNKIYFTGIDNEQLCIILDNISKLFNDLESLKKLDKLSVIPKILESIINLININKNIYSQLDSIFEVTKLHLYSISKVNTIYQGLDTIYVDNIDKEEFCKNVIQELSNISILEKQNLSLIINYFNILKNEYENIVNLVKKFNSESSVNDIINDSITIKSLIVNQISKNIPSTIEYSSLIDFISKFYELLKSDYLNEYLTKDEVQDYLKKVYIEIDSILKFIASLDDNDFKKIVGYLYNIIKSLDEETINSINNIIKALDVDSNEFIIDVVSNKLNSFIDEFNLFNEEFITSLKDSNSLKDLIITFKLDVYFNESVDEVVERLSNYYSDALDVLTNYKNYILDKYNELKSTFSIEWLKDYIIKNSEEIKKLDFDKIFNNLKQDIKKYLDELFINDLKGLNEHLFSVVINEDEIDNSKKELSDLGDWFIDYFDQLFGGIIKFVNDFKELDENDVLNQNGFDIMSYFVLMDLIDTKQVIFKASYQIPYEISEELEYFEDFKAFLTFFYYGNKSNYGHEINQELFNILDVYYHNVLNYQEFKSIVEYYIEVYNKVKEYKSDDFKDDEKRKEIIVYFNEVISKFTNDLVFIDDSLEIDGFIRLSTNIIKYLASFEEYQKIDVLLPLLDSLLSLYLDYVSFIESIVIDDVKHNAMNQLYEDVYALLNPITSFVEEIYDSYFSDGEFTEADISSLSFYIIMRLETIIGFYDEEKIEAIFEDLRIIFDGNPKVDEIESDIKFYGEFILLYIKNKDFGSNFINMLNQLLVILDEYKKLNTLMDELKELSTLSDEYQAKLNSLNDQLIIIKEEIIELALIYDNSVYKVVESDTSGIYQSRIEELLIKDKVERILDLLIVKKS